MRGTSRAQLRGLWIPILIRHIPAAGPNGGALLKRPIFWIPHRRWPVCWLVARGYFHRRGPAVVRYPPERIVQTLSDKLDSDVELGDLQLRVFPSMRVEGADLTIRRHGSSDDYPPLITVKNFHVDASIAGAARKHVDHVQLSGLTINIAPKPERERQEEHQGAGRTAQPVATTGEPSARRKTERPAERRRRRARPRRHRQRAARDHSRTRRARRRRSGRFTR